MSIQFAMVRIHNSISMDVNYYFRWFLMTWSRYIVDGIFSYHKSRLSSMLINLYIVHTFFKTLISLVDSVSTTTATSWCCLLSYFHRSGSFPSFDDLNRRFVSLLYYRPQGVIKEWFWHVFSTRYDSFGNLERSVIRKWKTFKLFVILFRIICTKKYPIFKQGVLMENCTHNLLSNIINTLCLKIEDFLNISIPIPSKPLLSNYN